MKFESVSNKEVFGFDSLGEMAEAVLGNKTYRSPYWKHRMSPEGFDPDRQRFIGRDFHSMDEVNKAVGEVWPEGMKVYEEMLKELEENRPACPKSIRRKAAWSEDGGDEVDIDRLRRGDAYWRTTRRESRPGPVSVTVISDMTTSAHMDSKDVLWRGAASVCLTKILEEAGYRVELHAANHSNAYSRAGAVFHVCLKRAGDFLDEVALVNTISGWCYRTIWFGAYSLHPRLIPSDSLGGCMGIESIQNLITPDEQVVVCSGIWDMRGAVQWVKNALEQIENIHTVKE